jgi:hypothetical protein
VSASELLVWSIADQSLDIDGGAVDDAPYQIEAPASTRILPTSVVGGTYAMGRTCGARP